MLGYKKTSRFLVRLATRWCPHANKNVSLGFKCWGDLYTLHMKFASSAKSLQNAKKRLVARFGPSHPLFPKMTRIYDGDGRECAVSLSYYDVAVFAAAVALLPQNLAHLRPIVDPELPEGHLALVLGHSMDKFPQNKRSSALEATLSCRSLCGLANSTAFQFHTFLGNVSDRDVGPVRAACLEQEKDLERLREESAGNGVPVPILDAPMIITELGPRYQTRQVHFRNGVGGAGTGQNDGAQWAELIQSPGCHGASIGGDVYSVRFGVAIIASKRARSLSVSHCTFFTLDVGECSETPRISVYFRVSGLEVAREKGKSSRVYFSRERDRDGARVSLLCVSSVCCLYYLFKKSSSCFRDDPPCLHRALSTRACYFGSGES